jgi:aspartate/methionine/tyrosine aminotransferase
MFSERSAIDLQPNAISTLLARLRSAGTPFIDLTLSNPTRADLALPQLPSLDRAEALRYEPIAAGLPSARRAVAAWMAEHACPVPEDRIVLTASTSEAYAYLFKALCDPGDEVLVPRPSYPLLAHLARFEAVALREYPIAYDGQFHLDRAALRSARSDRSRAVIAVHPNNPTGSYLSRDELRVLGELGLPLISDEVFAPYPLDPTPDACRSALELDSGLVVTLHGLSKLGLPQLKVSWMCFGGDDALVARALERVELIADTFLSVATPVQLALPELLRSQAACVAAVRERTRENLQRLRATCRDSALTVLHAGGGWNAVLRLPSTQSDEAWALGALGDAHVLIQPGYFYDFEGPPHCVVSLLPQPDTFAEGATRLARYVDTLTRT